MNFLLRKFRAIPEMQMSKCPMSKVYKLPGKKNRKKVAEKFGYIKKSLYLCIKDAKRTKASEIYGLAMEKVFLSARESPAWLRRKKRTKEEVLRTWKILYILKTFFIYGT